MGYKLGSLFDGSGGFPLAGALCGVEPCWASEVEPYPIAVTRSRFPRMKHLGDISKINGGEIEPVDIITFGSPCQDLSVAGKRAGLKHEANGDEETTRSGLFMEAVRIIKEMRAATGGEFPRFALWENVPGAFSSQKGEDFRVVLEEIIRVVEPGAVMPPVPKAGWAYADSYTGDGWSIAYRVFDAQYWGVPQRRRRIHLIADFRGQSAREVLFEREGLRGYFAEGRTPWQTTPADAQDRTGAADREGESGGDRGLDAVTSYTLKIRSGCEGGGKGALVQEDKSATLATNNDQYLFQPIALAGAAATLRAGAGAPKHEQDFVGRLVLEPTQTLCLVDSIGGQAERGWEGEVAPTLKATHYKNPPCVTMVGAPVVYDARGNRDGSTVNTLTGDHENRITDYTSVFCLQGNGIDGADTAGCNGKGWKEDTSYTLNTIDRPAVVYALDRASFNQGQNAKYNFEVTDSGVNPTLVARGPSAVAYDAELHEFIAEHNADVPHQQDRLQAADGVARPLVAATHGAASHHTKTVIDCGTHYIVRRLTPTECARLQGFADRWGDIEKKDSFTDEEYSFWLDVRNTHAAINGKVVKDYTAAQMLTWYNKLQTDSAEYKMWGNGIALPPALYCLQGIVDALEIDAADDWLA